MLVTMLWNHWLAVQWVQFNVLSSIPITGRCGSPSACSFSRITLTVCKPSIIGICTRIREAGKQPERQGTSSQGGVGERAGRWGMDKPAGKHKWKNQEKDLPLF